MEKVNIGELVRDLRNFKAITRKSVISELMRIIGTDSLEDAGFIAVGDHVVVVSCDGIVEEIVKETPRLAGYYSVIVNIGDVVAKGAKPIGFLCLVSSSSDHVRKEMSRGIKEGLDKFDLDFLKGHAHPDTTYDAVEGACVGLARRVLKSDGAKSGESLLFACDLEGIFTKGRWLNTFDSIRRRSKAEIRKQIGAMVRIAEERLASAARDVSGPSIVGTTAMLCEYSCVGALINLDKIIRPADVDLDEWLFTYPSTGYILTAEKAEECIEVFSNHGLQASIIGEVTPDEKIVLEQNGERKVFVDLKRESIFGFPKGRSRFFS